MRRVLVLLYAALFAMLTVPALAGGGDGEDEQSDPETLRRSQFERGSYPGGPLSKAPLATGYYVTDNDAPISGAPWQPSYEFFDTTGTDLAAWRRIRSGPNQGITTTPFGEEYFRNPNNMSDSTDDAFAGPISIGFPFYYYGIKYDSFYVSTNGLVGLSNRRYVYDLNGQRVGYDQFSDDPRARSGNAATDPVPDNYGYQYVALNNDNTNPKAGILNPDNRPFPVNSLRSVLAPMWDDLELSQLTEQGIPDDYGRVYWRLADNANKLVIYYVRLSMPGDVIKNVPVVNHQHRLREGIEGSGDRVIRTSFQVVLNRRDSSVQYNYRRFDGEFLDPEQGIFRIPAAALFRANATIGIQSHDKEYTNYLFSYPMGEGGISGAVYVNGVIDDTPHPGLAIQFKQWKNVVRVLEVSFQRPSAANPAVFEPLDRRLSASNYELLLGDPVLGVIRPVGIVENVSSDVGPVNITQQPIRFNVVFRIQDLVFLTRPPVYQKSETTQSLYPIAVAPGVQNTNASRPNIDTIIFDPYNPNPTVTKNVGRFKAEIIATDRGPGGIVYGDRWPFDDTTGVRIFGIRRVELPYITTFDNYNIAQDGIVPDVTNWVSIGAEVVDGEAATYNPPPPRTQGAGPAFFNSPVAKLDRRDIGGAFYNSDAPGVLGGDTLISFPINLAGGDLSKQPAILLSYERAGRQTYPRGWADATLIGPEQAVYNTLKTGFYRFPDHLIVEFAEPSNDDEKKNNVTNIRRWSQAGFLSEQGSIPAETYFGGVGSPRWGVFGGGGYFDTTGTLVIDEFDGGRDFLFRRGIVPIPRRWTQDVDVSKYFRFRLRVVAKSDKNPIGPPNDDEDPFYVDNIIVSIADKPEVEVTAITVDWPYTEAPASQARAIPLAVKVSNNGTTAATAFGVALRVENMDTPPTPGTFNYYRYKTIISLGAGGDRIENFPSWNAQECGAEIDAEDSASVVTNYRLTAKILPEAYDSYNANDETWTDFALRLGPTFAYEEIQSNGTVRNDVSQASGIFGKGLNLAAPYPDPFGAQPYGPLGGSISGTFAAQFRILTRDTIRGFQAYYGSANASPDNILYMIYKQRANSSVNAAPSIIPEDPKIGLVESTRTYARRGEGRRANTGGVPKAGPFYYNEYVIHDLDSALVVDPGLYFVAVAQLGQTGIELGASGYRQGQAITVFDPAGNGAGNVNVAGHPEMRAQTRFWYETTSESDAWSPMLTTIGNPGYPHLNIAGQNPMGFPTWQRGSWVPFIRPYFGYKSSTACEVLPVELADFRATALTSAIRLDWQTATELNNRGFNVERRSASADSWNDLAFLDGAGTSNQARDYSYVDNNVDAGVTYEYRLRQEDLDGTISYSGVRQARIDAATAGSAINSLGQNMPNPAAAFTTIPFVVNQSGVVAVEISDVYGNVVRTLQVETRGGAASSIDWDLTDAEGTPVANGTYIYKLVGNGFTQSRKMTVIR